MEPASRQHTDQHDSNASETADTFAQKLRAIGYQEPVLPRQVFLCRVANCQKPIPHAGYCDDCGAEMSAGLNPARSPASKLKLIAVILGAFLALLVLAALIGAHLP